MPCRKCQKTVTYESGIVCANFGTTRGRFSPCQGAWCAECFSPHDLDACIIKIPLDFEGTSLAEIEDLNRFKLARPGDHVCCTFQCPNCQSQNIRGLDLTDSIQDEAFECLCIRATLDAFWSRSTHTVGNHVREVRHMVRYGTALGLVPLPPLGPFPLGKHHGMLQAILLEARATEKGRKNETVQYGTARGTRATQTVVWEASPSSGSDIVLSSGSAKGKYVATLSPSESRWYSLFNKGVSARMGDVVRQDRAYSMDVLLALIAMYEEEWKQLQYEIPLESMYSLMFLLITCLGGMRGFEAVWTDLGALRYDVEHCESLEDESAISWPIVGRFKMEDGRVGCHMIPIAGTTDHGIRFFLWTQRFIGRLAVEGWTSGWAFRKEDGKKRAVASDYRENIFKKLEFLQGTTNLIDPACTVWDDFGIQRSGRRFLDTHCLNMGISETDLAIHCRWHQDRAKGERTVQRSMIQTYAEVRNMKKTLLRPSQAC